MNSFNSISNAGHTLTTRTRPWIRPAAKAGYLARGVVYLIVGVFALLAAQGDGETRGSKGALASLMDQPFGTFLLWLIAFGLVCYSIWRFVQAVFDVDDHGTEINGIAVRAGLLISSAVHLSLSVWSIKLAEGSHSSSGQSVSWSGWVLELPAGQWVMGAIAASVLGAGIAHLIKGSKAGFVKHFKALPHHYLRKVCQLGLISKGIVFGITSYLLFQSAILASSSHKKGLEGALDFVQHQSYGSIILTVLGFGLFSFGIYSTLEAVYRKIKI